MPRPVKCRKVCHFPQILEFLPADDTEKKTPIVLTVDEYEKMCIRDRYIICTFTRWYNKKHQRRKHMSRVGFVRNSIYEKGLRKMVGA